MKTLATLILLTLLNGCGVKEVTLANYTTYYNPITHVLTLEDDYADADSYLIDERLLNSCDGYGYADYTLGYLGSKNSLLDVNCYSKNDNITTFSSNPNK